MTCASSWTLPATTPTIVLQTTIANLTQHGVKVTSWIATACELQGDWAQKDTADQLLAVYQEHNPPWSFLETIQEAWKSLPNAAKEH